MNSNWTKRLLRKFLLKGQFKWLACSMVCVGLGFAYVAWSKREAANFYFLLTAQVVKEDVVTRMAMPVCSFAGISISDLEIINICSLNVQCGENVKMVFRSSPFLGTSTYPDTVAEKLAMSCPEIVKSDVLEATQKRTQKGG